MRHSLPVWALVLVLLSQVGLAGQGSPRPAKPAEPGEHGKQPETGKPGESAAEAGESKMIPEGAGLPASTTGQEHQQDKEKKPTQKPEPPASRGGGGGLPLGVPVPSVPGGPGGIAPVGGALGAVGGAMLLPAGATQQTAGDKKVAPKLEPATSREAEPLQQAATEEAAAPAATSQYDLVAVAFASLSSGPTGQAAGEIGQLLAEEIGRRVGLKVMPQGEREALVGAKTGEELGEAGLAQLGPRYVLSGGIARSPRLSFALIRAALRDGRTGKTLIAASERLADGQSPQTIITKMATRLILVIQERQRKTPH